MAGAAARFRFVDFLIRWLFIFGLLVATYNPTGYSYVHWLLVADSEYIPVKIFVGLILALLLWFIWRMVMRTMRGLGAMLGVLFFSSLTWMLESQGLFPRSLPVIFVLLQAWVSAWFAVGLSIVLFRQHIAGHVTAVDEVH